MNSLNVAIVVGPILLVGALLPAAGQSLQTVAPVQIAAGGDSTADRETYAQRARDEVAEWQKKLHDLSEKAEAKGAQVGNAVEDDLNKAWTKTEAASRRLQTAGAEGWESAKTSFENASHELTETWHRIHPEEN
jgi:Skp family chaperone for outer membrane proteins